MKVMDELYKYFLRIQQTNKGTNLCYYNHYVFFLHSFHNHIENGLSSDRNVCFVYSVYSTNKIMKIITIAFIFQFLLSCWPKVDIIS